MHSNCIMGIDPGIKGAVAFYYPSKPSLIAIYDIPVVGKEINCPAFASLIEQHCPDLAIVEDVHAMPKQGVTSSFNFGRTYGMIRGVVAGSGIAQILVSPAKWKKYFSLTSDKEKSRALAILKWPGIDSFNRKMDSDRAEAALIALYGAETLRNGSGRQ